MGLVFAGMQMNQMARLWFVYELTKSPLLLGITAAGDAIPMLTLSLFGGALADRLPKRNIILVGQICLAIMALAIAVDVKLGAIAWWHLALAAAFQGAVMSFIMPSRQALISELVDRPQLLNAVSLSTAEMNLNRILAPALAGFLIAGIGIVAVFLVMAGMYATSFLVMLLLPATRPVRSERRTVLRDMGDTFGYIRHRPVLFQLLMAALVASLFGMPLQRLLPVFSEDVLKVGPSGLGLLLSLMGLGALIGSVLTASLGDYQKKGLLFLILTLVFGAFIVAFSFSPIYLLSLALMLPVGVGSSGRSTVNVTLLQAYVDDSFRGRVMSLYMMEHGLQPLGLLPIAAAAEVIGAPIAVGISGAIVALYSLWALVFQPSLRKLA